MSFGLGLGLGIWANYEFEPPVSEPPQTLSAYICVPVGPTEMKVGPSINEETGRRFLVVSSP